MLYRLSRNGVILLFIFLFGAPSIGLFFTNCSPMVANSPAPQDTSLQTNTVREVATNGLVDPNNQYLYKCLVSSDGAKVAQDLIQKVKLIKTANTFGGQGKISDLDWKLQEDLLLTFETECIEKTGLLDPIFKHVNSKELLVSAKYSTLVAKKESVADLQKFTEDALNSDCLISAEKDVPIKINADQIAAAQMHLFTSQGPSPTSLKHSIGLIQGATKTSGLIDNIIAYVGPPSDLNLVKVAIVDSGIDCDHPDLTNMIARESSGEYFFMNTTSTGATSCQDSGFHGTHVSGLLAAEYNNNLGVMGAYGRNVKLYPYQFTNDGQSGSVSSIVAAINHAVDTEKVDLINLSLSTTSDVTSLRSALENASAKGVVVVVAAGNEKAALSPSTPRYPAMYSTASNGVVTVGSIDIRDNIKSSFTNFSSQYVDIMAPGSNGDNYAASKNNPDLNQGIISTVPLSTIGNMVDNSYGSKLRTTTGGWLTVQGTSMAAPLVTGALAAVVSMAKSKNVFLDKGDGMLSASAKTLTAAEVKSWLRSGSPSDSTFTNLSRSGAYLNMAALFNHASVQIKNKTNAVSGGTNTLVVVSQPTNRQAVVGETVDFSVEAQSSDAGAIQYQWFKGNTRIVGATERTLKIRNIQAADAGTYKAKVFSGIKTLETISAELSVGLRYCQN